MHVTIDQATRMNARIEDHTMTLSPSTPSTTDIVPGDLPIHLTVYEGTGPALLLLHGISGTGAAWWPIIDDLAESFTPVTIDLRGHGNSGKPEAGYLYDDYIGDLDRVLDHLGIDHPLIMGHSLGGLITLWWAARHPGRAAGLVIEDSPLRSGEDFRSAFDGWIHLNALPTQQVAAHYAAEHPKWKPETAQRRAEMMTSTARNVFAELRADSLANHGVDRIAEIEGVSSPVLLIHGDLESGGMVHPDDKEAFQRRLANASTHRIQGGSHGLHTDHARAFLAAAMPFLKEHASTADHLMIRADSPQS
jgi:pimeloyl-ACP methyl ester carboxylesterase